MSEIKTQKTQQSAQEYINSIENQSRRQDCQTLLDMCIRASGYQAQMWGSIVGFGEYHYKSERSRQEGDWPLTAFANRKQSLTVYIMPGFELYNDLLRKLGKHTHSVSCLYIKKLADIDLLILEEIIRLSVLEMKKRYDIK